MIGRTYTFSRTGMHCEAVDVEVDIKKGLPGIIVSGLLSQEVRESRERIRPAITNSGFDFPMKRVTVNLAPAETEKSGTHYDLAIAAAILKACGYIEGAGSKEVYFGELSLGGEIKWIRGILPMVMEAVSAGSERIYIPFENLGETAFLNCPNIIPLKRLSDLTANIPALTGLLDSAGILANEVLCGDYADVRGQSDIIKAYKIAASGHHHMLIVGPPGSGKTMSASRLPGIMPELKLEDVVEINKIYSIAAVSSDKKWMTGRPFRTPHNSSSSRAIIGGGPKVLPGEISLSHKGILFLDEFLEFRSDSLQALRTVIEKREVRISLRNGCAVYPADFLLVAASNPCPCGYYGTEGSFCTCSLSEVKKYRKKLRNPLIDRIDLQVKVDRINYKNLVDGPTNQSSKDIREEVLKAREIQNERFKDEPFKVNSEIPAERIIHYCSMEKGGSELIEEYMEENLLTARACHKILRIARTIADLKQHDLIKIEDIYNSINYRFLDMEPI